MKAFSLLSATMAIFTFSNASQAVPDPLVNLNTCLSNSNTVAGSNRCYALDNCNKNQSANKEQLRECIFAAEEKYRAEADAPLVGYGVAPANVPPPPEINSPVATEAADSDYSVKGGDQKGWENATQGD